MAPKIIFAPGSVFAMPIPDISYGFCRKENNIRIYAELSKKAFNRLAHSSGVNFIDARKFFHLILFTPIL